MREIYWKIFNNMYIGAADGLVAVYPVFNAPGDQRYRRTELELFI